MKQTQIRRSKANRKGRHDNEPTSIQPARQIGLASPTNASNILQLQSLVGNQQVQRMIASGRIQREGEEDAAEATGPLSKTAASEAITWYKAQPTKYTSKIVIEIQNALGRKTTGTMDAGDVQAVAQHQQDLNKTESPALTIDGKAGPRTLPTVFKEGLAQQADVSGFVAETRTTVFDKWGDLTAEERIRGLCKEANKHLVEAGVPECEIIIGDAEGNLGQFAFETWSLEIGKPAFEKADPTPAEKADMADTIYHESRHCEQWFRMAQLLASQKMKPKQILKKMKMKKESVAQAAFDKPLEVGSMQALMADGWFQSVYGTGAKHREAVLTELPKSRKALDEAKKDFKDNPTAENQKKLDEAKKRREKALKDYFDLPEENDAWHVGGRVTAEYMETEPEKEGATP